MEPKKRVTIKDLASVCEVSTATVSRVLNHIPGNYSAETEQRILDAAKQMGYYPNRMARSLITHKTKLIAVLVPDIHYYFFQDFFSGIDRYFGQFGYRILLCITQENAQNERVYLSELSNGLVDGIIVCTLNKKEDNSLIIQLAAEKYPVVTLERYGSELAGLCNVRIDNELAAKLAVDYLVENGHRNIAFLKGHPEANNGELRYRGYLRSMAEHGLAVPASHVRRADYLFEASVVATHELLNECPEVTAIIAANDLMSMGVSKAIVQAGKRVPDDVSVVALGGAILTLTNEPTLTTVDFQADELGALAGECLRAQIEGKPLQQREYVLRPVLNVEQSVRKLSDFPPEI